MVSVSMLNAVILSVITLNAVMVSVMAPARVVLGNKSCFVLSFKLSTWCFRKIWLRPLSGQTSIPDGNFTNILRAAFLYESFLRCFYVLTIWVCNFLAKGFWRKSFRKFAKLKLLFNSTFFLEIN